MIYKCYLYRTNEQGNKQQYKTNDNIKDQEKSLNR